MLKALCGGIAGGVLRPSSGPLVNWKPPPAWLDFIFDGTPMPAPLGLYFCQLVGDQVNCVNPITLASLAEGTNVYGIMVHIHGFQFILVAEPPVVPVPNDSLLAGASHRPSTFIISHSDSETVLLFDWGASHQGAEFRINYENDQSSTI